MTITLLADAPNATDWMSGVAAVFAAIAAFASVAAARKANKAATTLAEIEVRRRHSELRPTFDMTCLAQMDTRAQLYIKFTGPPELDHVTVRVSVRDDKPRQSSGIAGAPTEEQIKQQVWGPYQFAHAIGAQGKEARCADPFEVRVGDGWDIAMRSTPAPSWAEARWWEDQYRDATVRLALHCTHPGFDPWTLHRDVVVDRSEPERLLREERERRAAEGEAPA